MPASQRPATRHRVVWLCKRESECLRLVAAGHKLKTVGLALGISPWTAKEYVENARHRLGARTTAQAVAIAVRAGLI